MDGLTIGHYCCSVFNCTEPLAGQCDQYCPMHAALGFDSMCIIDNCTNQKREGKKTCTVPEHIEYEHNLNIQRGSIFRTRQRLHKAGVAPADDLDLDEHEVWELQDEHKSENGNRPVRAHPGRRRTHNEQIITRTCGIIIARKTCFGAEGIQAVMVRKDSSDMLSILLNY
jgi:hypothetical protein